jgi:predicted O-methyltransferase YrrM
MRKKYKLDKVILYAIVINDDLLESSVKLADQNSLFLEFGVAQGYSINRIAKATEATVYGFDSFMGLPEEWNGMDVGCFSTSGNIPEVPSNVKIVKGLFQDTLDNFLNDNPGKVGFCHIDSDLYSSAAYVLDKLKDRFFEGTILVFDELAQYGGYEDHEYKAFLEFLEYTGMDFEFIGRRSKESFIFRLLKG